MACGVDIIEIDRIKKSIEEHKEIFLKQVFTEREIEYCESHKAAKYQHYAARFASKEAVAKLLGTGFNGIGLNEIEIINDNLGKPEVILYNRAKSIFNEKYNGKIEISISHCKEYAVSMAISY